MSLRDELAGAFGCSGANDEKHARGDCEACNLAMATKPIIKRALAAERAATIEECKHAAQTAPTFSNDLIGKGKSYAVRRIDELPRGRSALDDVLAQARREQREKDARIARPVDEVLADIILAQED